ncbi:hypothetical protein DVVG_00008 [Dunaliella viridis virus SI2]|uniref:hypothetical protein n=1 Tax=Dunaliella viridis virus SI2 TaxID=754069 RepID=UPI0002C09CE6|nr:hypothetical protein DVVG_00008 [Dunaliella viridis virus SI2]AGH15994.1 hypothetical protein DVVG_00008 [Dunaliella viridis virus SI2]
MANSPRLRFNPIEPTVSRGAVADFGEVYRAQRDREQLVGELTSESRMLQDAYEPFQEYFNSEIRPMAPDFFDYGVENSARDAAAGNPGSPISMDLYRAIEDSGFHPDATLLQQFLDQIAEAGLEPPEEIGVEQLMARLEATRQGIAAEAQGYDEIISRGQGVSSFFASLAGGSIASLDNFETLITAPVGAASRLGILATAGIEGSLAAATEAATTPMRNQFLAELGLPEESILQNALFGFGAGAILGGGLRSLTMGAEAGTNALGSLFTRPEEQRALAQMMQDHEDPEIRAVAEAVLEDVRDAEAAGATGSGEARLEHQERASAAQAAAQAGEIPDIPDRPVAATGRVSIVSGELEEIDPRAIQREPEVFQFRSDADAEGVTDRLRDVPEWRSERAGVAIVFEYADGRQSIADGHQRTALANRIMASDPSQDIRMAARVFREVDGFTPENVRVIAALKNIAEASQGMTTALARDAARVLRVSQEYLRDLPRGPGIRRAQDLSNLSDDAFGLVINDVVPDSYAALVGRLVEDPSLHESMVRLIERTGPRTEAQAESVIRQALAAPVVRETAADLFGEEDIARSLYVERAKVLERATQLMREDERTFRTLTDRQAQIEGAGQNELDRMSNARMRELMNEALYGVDALAYRAGPISEALDNGARAYAKNGRLKDAAGEVVSTILDELRRNGLDGGRSRAPRQPAEPARQSAEAPDPNQGFDDAIDGAAIDGQIALTRLDRTAAAEGPNADLFDRVPVGLEEVDGDIRARTVSRADLEDEMAADEEFAEAIGVCLK